MTADWGADAGYGSVLCGSAKSAVKAEPGETVVFSWVVWPSKAARDAGNQKIMADPRMQMGNGMPFDGKRLIFGGFDVLIDTD